MKEAELRAATVCGLCKKPFGHTGLPLFWRVTVERYGVDMGAVKRQDGLAAMLGHAGLASVMGTQADMAQRIGEPFTMTVCETCATADGSGIIVAALEATA